MPGLAASGRRVNHHRVPGRRRPRHGRVRARSSRCRRYVERGRRPGRVLRGRVDRGHRPLHRLRDPVYLRWRMGDSFKPGPWTLGRKYKWMNPFAVVWVAICVVIFILPFTPGRRAVARRVRLDGASTTRRSGRRRDPRRRPLVAAQRASTRSRARCTRSTSSRRSSASRTTSRAPRPPACGAWPRRPSRSSSRRPRRSSTSSRARGVEDADAAVARAKAALPGVARGRAGRPRAAAAPAGRRARGAPRGARGPRGAQRRQADRRRARRDGRWWPTRSATTRARRSACWATRSPSPAAWRSPCASRSASSALITPWNFPLTIASWKLAPALAAGQHGRAQARRADAAHRAALRASWRSRPALPEGVVEVVAGPGRTCGQRLVEHPDVAKIAFTGSTEVGRSIAAGAAATIKRVTLELGGKSANVVFADADLERAAAAAPGGGLRQRGPGLLRALADPRASAARWTASWSALEEAVRGACASATRSTRPPRWARSSRAGQRETVASFVDDDAPVAIRGEAPDGPGFWFAADRAVPRRQRRPRRARGDLRARWRRSSPSDDEAEAVRLANDTIYGLSGSIWTRDGAKALRVARAIETGVLSINSNTSVRVSTPFGGFKQSGYGRELGPHATRRLHRGQDDLLRHRGARLMPAAWRARSASSPAPRAASARPAVEAFRREGATVVGVDLAADSPGDLALGARRHRRGRGARRCSRTCASATGASTSSSTTPASRPTTTPRCSTPSLEAWQRVQDVNLKSVFLCCKHGIPHLLENEPPRAAR